MPQRWWREVLPRLRAAAANGQPWFRRAVKQRRQAQHLITIPVGSGDGSPCQAICCVSGNSFVMWDVQWANGLRSILVRRSWDWAGKPVRCCCGDTSVPNLLLR